MTGKMEKQKNLKPFKILALDGGGIKGLYTASLLSVLEKKSKKKSGECFDLIAGTSTGGFMALGLASGKNAGDLVNLYEKFGKYVFPTSNNKFIRWFQLKVCHLIKQTFLLGKYRSDKLKNVLESEFKKQTIGDLNNLLIIPSFNLISHMPRVFKYPHAEGDMFRDRYIPLVDVALATSAAPTYFPIHKYDKTLYVDGGVWANNPSLCAVTEAIQYFVGEDREYSHIEILSISCSTESNGWVSKVRKKRSFLGWRDKLFETAIDGQSYFTDFFLKNNINVISPNSIYKRITMPCLSLDQMKVIKMDRADKKAIDTLKSLGNQKGYELTKYDEVMNFFKTKKSYKTKNNNKKDKF